MMVDLITLLASTLALPHIEAYKQIDSKYEGMERRFLFWMNVDGNLSTIHGRILVKDTGPAEDAQFYNPQIIEAPSTAFRTLVDASISTYLAANPEIEKWQYRQIDETGEWAKIKIWENDGADNIEEKLLFVYKDNGGLTARPLTVELPEPFG